MAESMGSACEGLYARLGELQTMTRTDAVIAQYFEDSFPHLALENLDEISVATGTSTASVTRFVRKLGYASFRDFSRSLREEVAANFDLSNDRTTNGPTTDGPGAMWRSKMEAARRSIDIGLNSLDGEAFDRVVEVLRDDSRPLCLAAAAPGHTLLDYFGLLARYYRRDVILLESTDRMAHQLIDLPDDAVLLASVFDRHSRMVESVLRLFHERNMTTVLLTNRSSTPMRRYADHVLLVASESSTAFRSRACYLILLESLVAALAPEDHEVERCRVEAMQGLCDELGIFITPSMPSLTRRTLTGGCR
ncbi:RpiR family transcriptional regulator [Cutibacterium modestum 28N]|uniref:MurR/RpiR family transcriptional regulator n=3 Tax=Bacteria TaxID=2 RepID=A0AAD1KQL8_9ACTN|nr:RpiR family transcriptional regulator [Cutibacterium modestum 28N]BCY25804.1 hypothetical protein KB1_17940 [Cutibacterium modestum]